MSFYTSIAPYYDLLFPFDDTQVRFLETVIDPSVARCAGVRPGAAPLPRHGYLDLGCGTGTFLSAFSDRFKRLVGIDNDPGILALAAEKLLPGEGKKVELLDESLLALETILHEDEFSLITCLGNTLPHLTAPGEIAEAFRLVRNHLGSGGAFVFQTINYDRILEKALRGLPTISRGEITFERFYSLPGNDGLIDFDTILSDPEKEIEIRNSAKLFPLKKKQAEDWLSAAGFTSIVFYGDYTGAPWTNESYLCVGVCS